MKYNEVTQMTETQTRKYLKLSALACNRMSHGQIRKGYDQGLGCDDANKCNRGKKKKHFTTKLNISTQVTT